MTAVRLRRSRPWHAVLVAAALLLTGCTLTPQDVGVTVECRSTDRVTNSTIIAMAQSVPTATLIPCLRLLPAGWNLADLDVRRGKSRFVLASDRDGDHALTVVLSGSCDIAGAVLVPTDEAGTHRYERPLRITSGYAGDRYYVYPGGCTTYQFDLHGSSRAEPVNESSLAVGFVSREAVRAAVSRDTHGKLQLDPTSSSS
jgi:hypothetical protein